MKRLKADAARQGRSWLDLVGTDPIVITDPRERARVERFRAMPPEELARHDRFLGMRPAGKQEARV